MIRAYYEPDRLKQLFQNMDFLKEIVGRQINISWKWVKYDGTPVYKWCTGTIRSYENIDNLQLIIAFENDEKSYFININDYHYVPFNLRTPKPEDDRRWYLLDDV
jgi:hypothetical protein